jgi:probable F420-dependent oxidoreductase
MSGPTLRRFRFGVQAKSAPDGRTWRELARRCEGLGYDVLTIPDHLDDQLAPLLALQAAADATTSLRIGTLVLDNDYRHPVVLAKELATLDLLSDGRLEIGLGAGWMVSDYQQSGIAYDTPGVRVDRFTEGLAIIQAAFGPEPFDHVGHHYQVTGYRGTPRAVQGPRPPILIGGGGRRVLELAARQADIVGINASLHSGTIDQTTLATMTAESVDAKLAWVRAAAKGRRAFPELNVRVFLVEVTHDRAGALARLAQFTGFTAEELADSPFALVGPPEALAEDLLARRQRWGFSYVIVGADQVEAFAPVVAALAGR